MSGDSYFSTPISRHIWETKYRYQEGGQVYDRTVADTWRRVARALAAVEGEQAATWERSFFSLQEGFKFLPGGRIQAGAGTARNVTLFNCFVMGVIADSLDGIFDSLKEGALTMQQGGGVGYDFSTLRPRGTLARGVGAIASGPVSFMGIWDSMCATILSTGARRGAMMATLRCDHPDIDEFISAKRAPGRLRRFNLSVLLTDAFMQAVQSDESWPLVFPEEELDGLGAETVLRRWSGKDRPVPCRIVRRVPARQLWDRIMAATYDYAEPGVLFIDRINDENNLWYREHISATNPCGEIPLPPYGACDLGSINLTRFVKHPFGPGATLDTQGICSTAAAAVRLLDNVIDASRFPLPEQRRQAVGTRRIGLGITGLGDALAMLGQVYGSPTSLASAEKVMRAVCHTAYRASIELAREKGAFPFFDREAYLQGPFVRRLPPDIRDGVARHGIRNSHLLAIAPTGTISLLANNISGGVEPIFALRHERRVLNRDGTECAYALQDHAWQRWAEMHPGSREIPEAFVAAAELPPAAHLDMQAAVQSSVDNSVSKTINVPVGQPFEAFKAVYAMAYEKGLKGCTTFRPNPTTGAVLTDAAAPEDAPHCCTLEREGD